MYYAPKEFRDYILKETISYIDKLKDIKNWDLKDIKDWDYFDYLKNDNRIEEYDKIIRKIKRIKNKRIEDYKKQMKICCDLAFKQKNYKDIFDMFIFFKNEKRIFETLQLNIYLFDKYSCLYNVTMREIYAFFSEKYFEEKDKIKKRKTNKKNIKNVLR